jgi:hypothetical protein
VGDLVLTYSFTATTYTYNTPTHAAANGVTPSVSYSLASPRAPGTSVTATVSFAGTATQAGTLSVNLSSSTTTVTGGAQTLAVTAGQNSGFGTKTFSFTVPSSNVTDLVLTYSFTPTYSLTVARVGAQTTAYGSVATTGSTTGNAANASVTVTATPGSNYIFKKWVSTNSVTGTEVSTANPYTFNINANTSLYAVFDGNGSSASYPSELHTASSLTLLTQYAAANKYFKLMDNITITSQQNILAANVNLDGGGYTITRGTGFTDNFFLINTASAALTLTNITLDGGYLVGVTAIAPLVNVGPGTLTLGSGATLQNNTNSDSSGAGGVKVVGGSLIMQAGASITDNRATFSISSNRGGGVYMSSGSFTMNGGTISGNIASSGGTGGVLVGGGTFTVNAANQAAGQAYVSGNLAPEVTKSGGTINGTAGITAGW